MSWSGTATSSVTVMNVAARLEGLAEPAGFPFRPVFRKTPLGGSISRSMIMANKLSKNIARPVRVYRVRESVSSQLETMPSWC